MTHRCYTDASFCPKTKLAVYGYYLPFLTPGRVEHNFTYLENTTNTEAEVKGLLSLLKMLDDTELRCDVFTDCKSAVDKIQERNDNTSLFVKIYDILDRNPNISIKHIQGHKPKKEKTEIDLEFSVIDKAVRKELRKIRNQER